MINYDATDAKRTIFTVNYVLVGVYYPLDSLVQYFDTKTATMISKTVESFSEAANFVSQQRYGMDAY